MKKQKLGISIYPHKAGEKETIEYIKLANKYGIKTIFSNLLEVKNDADGKKVVSMLTRVFKVAKNLGFKIILDVNPKIYKNFELKQGELEFFKDMNVSGIRLDEDFGGLVETKMSQNKLNMEIQINASANFETINNAIKNNVNLKNITACHNFYPMEYTGLAYDKFISNNLYFYKLGIEVSAFITLPKAQFAVGPWDVNEGMSTIEIIRNATLENQLKHLSLINGLSTLIIAQQPATETQLKLLSNLIKNEPISKFKVIDLQKITNIEKKILDYPHVNRVDYNDYFIRSTITRIHFKDEKIPPRKINKKFFEVGDILITNDLFGRYKAELHIVKKAFPNGGKRNYIGKVKNYAHGILPFSYSGKKFSLV